MMLRDASIVSRPLADATSEPDPTASRGEATELAHVFDSAQRAPARTEWLAERSATDAFPDLMRAVREFVVAHRADGSPPERVLAAMKRVTRACTFVCVDESRCDRLQHVVLSEFLATYYDVVAAAHPPLEAPE